MEHYLTLLIVDDESSIRNGLTTAIMWHDIGITVVGTASDGIEALEMIRTLKPNIVITDIRMPRCDGLDLIKIAYQDQLPCKFIILSGYDDFKYAQTAIRYRVSSYLVKPIQIAELLKEVCILRDLALTEMKKNDSMINTTHQIIMQNRALKENFYTKLLENEYRDEEEIKRQLNSLQLPLTISSTRVLVFTYSFNEQPEKTLFNLESNNLFQSAAINIIDEILEVLPRVVFSKESTSIIAIINVASKDEPSMKQLHILCQKIVDYIRDFSKLSINVSIGDTASTLLKSQASYLNALEALSYSIYGTQQRIFDSTVISREAAPIISHKNQKNQEIIDAIYRNDKKELDTLLHAFFHSLFYVETPPPNYIRGMCIFLFIDVQNGLSTYLEESSQLFMDIPFVEINQLPSFSIIREWITNKFYFYTDYIHKNCSLLRDPIIQKAKSYIKDNIYKKIKAEDVAAHVGLSENYFTVYFKEKTSENFKTFIQNLKMERAKEHLKTSNILISELSSLLGYEDYRSFNRAFKKETDSTPSEYQQRYQSKYKG